MIEITSYLTINPTLIASVEVDHRSYMNGSTNYLVITMADGKVHRIEHGYWKKGVAAAKETADVARLSMRGQYPQFEFHIPADQGHLDNLESALGKAFKAGKRERPHEIADLINTTGDSSI